VTADNYGYAARIDALRATKVRHTQEKQSVIGAMDFDDHAIVLPAEDNRRIVELMGPSGVPITDVLFANFEPESNHPGGGAFGAAVNGRNFRRILELHNPYIDPMSSLAGCYRTNFMSYRQTAWNPDLSYEHLHDRQQKYRLQHGIGAVQHFCQDMTIGYTLGWNGISAKIAAGRAENTDAEAADLYDGFASVVSGIQTWIRNHADAAEKAAEAHDGAIRDNLLRMARINHKLVADPPE
jgi:hypothetical protein